MKTSLVVLGLVGLCIASPLASDAAHTGTKPTGTLEHHPSGTPPSGKSKGPEPSGHHHKPGPPKGHHSKHPHPTGHHHHPSGIFPSGGFHPTGTGKQDPPPFPTDTSSA